MVFFSFLCSIIATFFEPFFKLMPYHVDSWIVLSSRIIEGGTAIFGNVNPNYPPGSHTFFYTLATTAGINPLIMRSIFLFITFILIAILIYSISKRLFNNKTLSITTALFSFLILTNITILGPKYLVPITFAIPLALTFLYLILEERWWLSFLIFIPLVLTHATTTGFTLILVFLYFLFSKEHRTKIPYILGLIILAILGFLLTRGAEQLIARLSSLVVFSKAAPYYFIQNMYGWVFFALIAIGLLLILIKEDKAKRFLTPIFIFMAFDMFLYWQASGFFIVYRRLLFFLTFLSPFFIGYSVYWIAEYTENILSKIKVLKWIKVVPVILIIFLIILVPYAISINNAQFARSYVYVNENENKLFATFGKEHPGEYLIAHGLMGYALPYYKLQPVSLAPMHGFNRLHYSELEKIYITGNLPKVKEFMQRYNYQYITVRTNLTDSDYKIAYEQGDSKIYKLTS